MTGIIRLALGEGAAHHGLVAGLVRRGTEEEAEGLALADEGPGVGVLIDVEEEIPDARDDSDERARGGDGARPRRREPVQSRHQACEARRSAEELRLELLDPSPQRADVPSAKRPDRGALEVVAPLPRLDQEHLRAICLDTKNRVQKIHTIYVGSLNSSLVRVGEVFKEPIRLNSAAIIVVHNHPSGDPTPSADDRAVTRQLVDAGRLLDLPVYDHVIIGAERYVSFAEAGLL